MEEDKSQNPHITPDPLPPVPQPPISPPPMSTASAKIRSRWWSTKKGKIILLSSTVLSMLLIVLFTLPVTRYAIVGLVVKKDVTLTVVDSATSRAVSDLELTLAMQKVRTDGTGKAVFKGVPVGEYQLHVTKKYYKDTNQKVTVPIFSDAKGTEVRLEAIGRQVPIRVTNMLTGKPVGAATVLAGESSAKTDEKGETVIVLPADQTSVKAILRAEGYNETPIIIAVTEQADPVNEFTMTQTGKIYFLSKRTGKINVMKANLDGTGAKVVIEGTGKEEDRGTVLLASRDWKYLALKSRRDSDKPKLYSIDTTHGDTMAVMDEGDADFTMVGWHNSHFVYTVSRNAVKAWQPKGSALKSFNAATGDRKTLDETGGDGTNDTDFAREAIGSVYILSDRLVYPKYWSTGHATGPARLNGYSAGITSIGADGSNKKVLKEFALNGLKYAYIDARAYAPDEIYYRATLDGAPARFYEYENGTVVDAHDITSAEFDEKFYPTYLVSPSGKKTFWHEPRDGKNTLLVGNQAGKDGKELFKLSDYTAYGWFSDEYVLVAKNNSELYIAAAETPENIRKITDYHKPNVDFSGYGYGYGGF